MMSKSVRFEGLQAGTRLKNGSFGIAVSGTIVLGALLETNKPLLDSFTATVSHNLHSPFISFENRVFDGFHRLKRR